MKSLFLLAYLSVFLYAVTCIEAQGDNDVRPPENVRIVRERSGESNDRLVAKWDAPSSGNVDYYWVRWRSRESGSTDWGGWEEDAFTNGTSENIVNLAGGSDALMRDYRVGLRSIYNSRLSEEVTATWRFRRSSRRSRGKEQDDSSSISFVPRPSPKTCELLSNSGKGISVSSPQGLGSGIQCQQIGAAGIGVAMVIEAGFVDAVDVWGVVATAEVCFSHGDGEFLFLDASTAPRTVTELDGYSAGGMICARIDRPGSVVLIPRSETSAPSPLTSDESAQIERCFIVTNFILNLRDAPTGSNVLAWIPYNVTLRVTARSGDWLKVNWNGISGWIISDLVRRLRACA